MTPTSLDITVKGWRQVHEAIHGPLTQAEVELVDELKTHLTDVLRAEQHFHRLTQHDEAKAHG